MKAEVTFHAAKAAVATVKTEHTATMRTRSQNATHAAWEMLLLKLNRFSPTIPGVCSVIVYVPHSSFATTTPPSDP